MPLLQREGGKGYMCVWEGGRIGLVLTYDKLVSRAVRTVQQSKHVPPDCKDVPVAA